MRALSEEHYSALSAKSLMARDFIWFIVRDPASGAPVTDGYWSDVGDISAQVINPDTGGPVTRTFHGGSGLIQISDIPLVSNITVQTVSVRLAQAADRVNELLRAYDCKQGQVQIWRGLFDVNSRVLVDAAPVRFAGFIDTIDIRTPSENQEGGAMLTCMSHTQEMTRSNPDTRSHESQILRSSTDNFFQDASVVGDWQHFWGRASGTAS